MYKSPHGDFRNIRKMYFEYISTWLNLHVVKMEKNPLHLAIY